MMDTSLYPSLHTYTLYEYLMIILPLHQKLSQVFLITDLKWVKPYLCYLSNNCHSLTLKKPWGTLRVRSDGKDYSGTPHSRHWYNRNTIKPFFSFLFFSVLFILFFFFFQWLRFSETLQQPSRDGGTLCADYKGFRKMKQYAAFLFEVMDQ